MDKTLHRALALACRLLAALLLCGTGAARAQAGAPLALGEQMRSFVLDKMSAPAGAGKPRVEVVAGQLDGRLRLAPCEQIQLYLPTGARLWGRTRVGVRCVKGVTPWNVYLPVTVNVYAQGLVASGALPAGHVLLAEDFHQAEVNLAEDMLDPAITESHGLVGRVLARPVSPGQSLRSASLKARQWFAAGDRVQIRAVGSGFAVAGSGEALTPGQEGLPARVRTETGRVVQGMPVGERQLEITL